MKKRIKSKKIKAGESCFYNWYYKVMCPHISPIIRHDNSKAPVGRGGAHDQYERFPSVKRSDKVWKNFYHSFPWVWFKVKEQADKLGIKSGVMNISWETRATNENRRPLSYSRTIKVKVFDDMKFNFISEKEAQKITYDIRFIQ